jgi:hypothetical protein
MRARAVTKTMKWLWGILAAIALLWPDHLSGPFDGVPLDRTAEAILIGVVLPALWLHHPRFLATRFARASIVALIVWKAAAVALFVQDGWCIRFEPSRPYAIDAAGAPHAWDLRADWRSPDPACSAIMRRSYATYREFPTWFFNLPPPSDSWPLPEDLPPAAVTGLRLHGFLSTTTPGSLDIDLGPGMTTTLAVDGRLTPRPVHLDAGTHQIVLSGTMTRKQWRLVPLWDGKDLWSNVTATMRRPSARALRLRPLAWWIPFVVTATFLGAWVASALARIRSFAVLAWMIGSSLIIGWLTGTGHTPAARWLVLGLAASVLVPVPPRLRNLSGTFLLVGVPWLTFVVVYTAPGIGLWGLYAFGNDFWMYQRYGYRIVMQGYWLEGGSPIFYFQPLYRWISGLLHAVFGDSSAGEFFWDGGCLLAGALLAARITRAFAGFRWGLTAAVAPLAVFELSKAHDLLGRGLSEISSEGLLCMSALWALRARNRTSVAIGAGVLATLAFYTRLNNLLMALGVAVFALPLRVPMDALRRRLEWWPRVSWRIAAIVPGVVGLGLLALAWRLWLYTGVFSPFHGTNLRSLATWQPGMPVSTVVSRMLESVLLVLTVNDPPHFDIYAVPVLAGAIVAVLSLLGLPRLRTLPAAAVLFFFAAIAGALVARGSAYTGRFSVHVMPITCALTICAVSSLTSLRPSRSKVVSVSRPVSPAGHDARPVGVNVGECDVR